MSVALGAAEELAAEHGVDPTVADARFAKPLDEELIERLAAEHDLLVTVEENVLAGGFGSGVLEHLADRDLLRDTRVLRFGLPDRYVTHGKPALLREEVGLTPRPSPSAWPRPCSSPRWPSAAPPAYQRARLVSASRRSASAVRSLIVASTSVSCTSSTGECM